MLPTTGCTDSIDSEHMAKGRLPWGGENEVGRARPESWLPGNVILLVKDELLQQNPREWRTPLIEHTDTMTHYDMNICDIPDSAT
jgi:hypothetical protein